MLKAKQESEKSDKHGYDSQTSLHWYVALCKVSCTSIFRIVAGSYQTLCLINGYLELSGGQLLLLRPYGWIRLRA